MYGFNEFLAAVRRAGFGLFLLLVLAGTGCRVLQNAADVPAQAVRSVTPGSKAKPAADPVEVQQKLLRFADEYSMRMVASVDNLRRGTNALTQTKVLETKIEIGSETWAIAAGPNAVADLLDMTVFVTVTRMALEDYWQPKIFGDSAAPMLAYSRNAETEIWALAGTVLTPEQQTELLRSITAWHEKNPLPESLVAVRALGFAAQIAESGKGDATKPGSVFSLLMIDPLAGVDPAVREIAQTRMFAERALFVTQKMPMLLRWQTELLSLNAVQMPAVQQAVANSTQIANAVERFAAVAEKLPDQFSNERAEILKALQSQEKEVAALLTNGTQMSDSVNTTLTTFDALMKHVQPAGKPGLIQGGIPVEVIQDPVTVTAIDAAQRRITLQHANESTKIFTVAATVNNLDQVKVGDTIKATVRAELSIYILEHGRLPGANGTSRPKTINFNAKVLLVDPSYRLLTLQFNNGKTLTIKAGLDVHLEQMAPGDDVVMRSNVVTAIAVKKP